jgi:hypothetical protein
MNPTSWKTKNRGNLRFNSAIQLIKANARGFRNFANYRARVLFHCGKLDMSLG